MIKCPFCKHGMEIKNKTKLVAVRFRLYKCGASLNYSCRLNDNFIRAIRTAALTK